AAAEVPKNGENPFTEPTVPSAAVTSGLDRTAPPVWVKLPGVIGVPSAVKNTRRGPSEGNRSGLLLRLNRFGNGPARVGGGARRRGERQRAVRRRGGHAERVRRGGVPAGHPRRAERGQAVRRVREPAPERGELEVPVGTGELDHRDPAAGDEAGTEDLERVL